MGFTQCKIPRIIDVTQNVSLFSQGIRPEINLIITSTWVPLRAQTFSKSSYFLYIFKPKLLFKTSELRKMNLNFVQLSHLFFHIADLSFFYLLEKALH